MRIIFHNINCVDETKYEIDGIGRKIAQKIIDNHSYDDIMTLKKEVKNMKKRIKNYKCITTNNNIRDSTVNNNGIVNNITLHMEREIHQKLIRGK